MSSERKHTKPRGDFVYISIEIAVNPGYFSICSYTLAKSILDGVYVKCGNCKLESRPAVNTLENHP